MEQRLREVLSGKEENYILPFFWQHGEDRETLKKYIRVIRKSGIRAVCVESRPHPDFLGEKWWEDMDVILEEAAELGMKVWVLDDAHFPTGYCNGRIAYHPEYGKIFLDHYTIDVCGPEPYASFLVRLEEGERFLGAVAARRKEGERAGELLYAADITDSYQDGLVSWSVPEGYWNIIVLKTTRKGNGRKDYCNLLDRDAVRFFLDTVYEPHWEHYRERFGETFAGFFSDEPELGNTLGEYPDSGIGQPTMPLPWCTELEELAGTVWGEKRNLCLAALWSRLEEECKGRKIYVWDRARYEYMNMVTDLYGRNFCGQVGEWCALHGVEYIGHVIEDNGNHARTGYGTGHFFKALWGQHMSGIDVVLQQIRPGYDNMDFYHIGGKNTYDGRFFHYGLAKMGASLAHLDPKKAGRTMCEVYGAYGWCEGLKLMKWLADHMLVRGVNWFVPHAFTPAEFPDKDCPPHFYAQGKNPQYPWFGDLMGYMNRMSHLQNGGEHVAEVAVLYTAELQWIGACTPFEETGRLLLRSQIDYDVVPVGLLPCGRIGREDGRLHIGDAAYRMLVIPECERIPSELADWIEDALDEGFSVLFSGKRPEVTQSGWKQAERFYGWKDRKGAERGRKLIHGKRKAEPVLYNGVDQQVFDCVREVRCLREERWLRYCHYRHKAAEGCADYYFFFQESPTEKLKEWITVEMEEPCSVYWYDGWDNCLRPVKRDEEGRIYLSLSPYETAVLCVERSCEKEEESAWLSDYMEAAYPEPEVFQELSGSWSITLRSFDDSSFGEALSFTSLRNITAPGCVPDFSGTICYETDFVWNTQENGTEALIDCGEVYETLEVWLNGKKQAVRIAPPYRFRAEGLVDGGNHLTLYITNTLVHSLRDPLSATMPVEASGLLGPVRIAGLKEIENTNTMK